MSAVPEAPVRIAVIGGGITGLAAAHRLVELSREHRRAIEVALFEAGDRLGGVIASECRDGFVIEAGPDSFLSEKPWGLALCERLGLRDELIGTRDELRRTYVVHAQRLHPLPDGFLLLAPTRLWPLVASSLFSLPGKLRMSLDLLLPRATPAADESLASFVTRRLGREAVERVAQPLVGGIYTADPSRLSLAATMPRFLELERCERSIIWAMWRQQRQAGSSTRAISGARWSLFVSLRRGMETLVAHLAHRLPEGVVRLRAPVRHVDRAADGWRLDGSGTWDAVIVATPAHVGAGLMRAVDDALATQLQAIGYASSAIVTLAYRREDVPHPLNGFGFVVPRVENRTIVACTFSSVKYAERAPRDVVLFRTFVGGALQPQLFAQDDPTMEDHVRRELRELLGITAAPILRRLARHPQSMPQYHVGHLDRVAAIEQQLTRHPGLYLAGNAYRGVGLPDCIHSGETAAEAAFGRLANPHYDTTALHAE